MDIYTNKYSIIYEKRNPPATQLNFPQSELRRAHRGDDTRPRLDFPRLGPDLSFRTGLAPKQARGIKIGGATLGLALLNAPILTLALLAGLFFAVFSLLVFWRAFLIFVGTCLRLSRRPSVNHLDDDQNAPIYSILIPLY